MQSSACPRTMGFWRWLAVLTCRIITSEERMATAQEGGRRDLLDRSRFVSALVRHISELAQQPLDHLPAPRVLAVDAPWGSGKSWVAQKPLAKLKQVDEKDAVLTYRSGPFSTPQSYHGMRQFETPASAIEDPALRPLGGYSVKKTAPLVRQLRQTTPHSARSPQTRWRHLGRSDARAEIGRSRCTPG